MQSIDNHTEGSRPLSHVRVRISYIIIARHVIAQHRQGFGFCNRTAAY